MEQSQIIRINLCEIATILSEKVVSNNNNIELKDLYLENEDEVTIKDEYQNECFMWYDIFYEILVDYQTN
ncbi:MAG: hypothetical protein ACRC0V_08465 [Fusobacteriaceae bacterium]